MFRAPAISLRSTLVRFERPAPSLPHPRERAVPSTARSPRRVLVLCLGGIGDTVLSFAALRDLRRACPDDHLTALVMWKQAADLLSDLGIFDEVIQHNFQSESHWSSLRTALRLRWKRFDVSLLAFPANRFEYNAVAYLLGAAERFGHGYVRGGDAANLRFLLTDRIEQVAGRHVVDENRALVARFCGRPADRPADLRLGRLDPQYAQFARRMLEHLDRPLLGVHAGSSSYKGLTTKRWPLARFGELCRTAYDDLGLQPLVFGLPDEITLKLEIQALCPQVFLAHGPTLRHTAAMMQRCAAFVSNDSALAHLAQAAGVPVVMVGGPTDPGEVGPYGHPERALWAGLPCSPCFRVGRKPMACSNPVHQACLHAVGVDTVLAAVSACLTERLPSTAALRGRRFSLPVMRVSA